jgi:hypothetical protein
MKAQIASAAIGVVAALAITTLIRRDAPPLPEAASLGHHGDLPSDVDHAPITAPKSGIRQREPSTVGDPLPTSDSRGVLMTMPKTAEFPAPWDEVMPSLGPFFKRPEGDREELISRALSWPPDAIPWGHSSYDSPTFREEHFNPEKKTLSEPDVVAIQASIAPINDLLRELGSESFDYLCAALDEYVARERFWKSADGFLPMPVKSTNDNSLYELESRLFYRGWYITIALRSSEYPEFQVHLENIELVKRERDEIVRSHIAGL